MNPIVQKIFDNSLEKGYNCPRCGSKLRFIYLGNSMDCLNCCWHAAADFITGEWRCTEDYEKLGCQYFEKVSQFGMR